MREYDTALHVTGDYDDREVVVDPDLTYISPVVQAAMDGEMVLHDQTIHEPELEPEVTDQTPED